MMPRILGLILLTGGPAMAESWTDLAGLWRLAEIEGAAATAEATLEIGEGGVMRGNAPCNSFGFRQHAVFPAFQAGPIRATKMACPDLPAESAFLGILQSADTAALNGAQLVLRDPMGRTLAFEPAVQPD